MLRFGFWLSVARAGFWVQQDRKGFTWQVQPLALSGRQQVQGAPRVGLIPQGFQQDLVKEICWGHFRAEGSKAIPEKPPAWGCVSTCPCVHPCFCAALVVGPSIARLAIAASMTWRPWEFRASPPSSFCLPIYFLSQ